MPRSRQELRSEDTKRSILQAAGQLFAVRGFDAVTMREIAKAAGCSHTTIYLYFKDKETLLHQLSMEPLHALRLNMETVLDDKGVTPKETLKSISREFIRFCLLNRNLYTVFFMTKATRVDEEEPATEVNQLRLHLFRLLRQAIQGYLPPEASEEQLWAYARVYFFTLHGIVGTYTGSEEPYEELMARLAPTFELAVDVLLEGIKQTVNKGDV